MHANTSILQLTVYLLFSVHFSKHQFLLLAMIFLHGVG